MDITKVFRGEAAGVAEQEASLSHLAVGMNNRMSKAYSKYHVAPQWL